MNGAGGDLTSSPPCCSPAACCKQVFFFSESSLEVMLCPPRAWMFDLSQSLGFIVMNQMEMLKNAYPGGCAASPYAASLCGASQPWPNYPRENAFTSPWAALGILTRDPEPHGSPQPQARPGSWRVVHPTAAPEQSGRWADSQRSCVLM